jgi:hypothetical protein
MAAEPVGCEPEVYTIHARNKSVLGHAEWYPRWRGYVFSPEDGIVLSHDCCLEMARFLESCNRAKKYPQTYLAPGAKYDGDPISEETQNRIKARLQALPSESVAMFWRQFRVSRIQDFDKGTMPAVRQVLDNMERYLAQGI